MLNQRAFVAGLLTVCGLMFTLGDAKAQQQGGIFELGFKPYGSFEGGNIDTVDLMNRALHVRIPVVSYPQRGGVLKMPLYHAYTSLLFQGLDISNGGGCTSACYTYIIPTGNVGSGPLDITMNVQRDYTFPYAVWAISQDGSRHITSGHDNFTRDGTGYQVGPVVNPTRPCPWTDWVADRTGVRRSFGCTGSGTSAQAFGYYEDANGNKITENYANGGLSGWTDTMGRVIPYYAELPSNKTSDLSGCTGPLPTDSAYLWSIPGIGGGMQTSKLCVAIVTANIPCTGRCQTAHEWYPATQAIVLPNGTSWVFQYDSADPNDPNSRGYGDLLKITFPTGGSLSYTWQSSPSTIECSPGPEPVFIRVVASRTLDANDGQGPHTWTYTGGNGAGQTTVQDPLGNETVHAFTLFPNNAGGPSCAEYETVTQRYQGTSTSGTLIQSITTDYTTAEILPPGVLNWYPAGLPIRITTTTLDTGQQRKVEMDYNYPLLDGSYQVSDGNVSAQREYDYGQSSPGPLLRSTVKSYVDSANSNYLNANLLTLLASVTVRDGAGTQKSYSTFNYDGYPLASSGVTMQHDLNPPNGSNRGNQTSSSRWLNTTGGYLTATSKYFDTGTVQTATDPLGHATAYSYSSTFAGAYPTTVTNSLQQATVRGYDFTTGLVTSITDLNNQPTTYQYNDPLSRLTEVDHPDGGKTTGTYNDTASPPNLVESELIRSTLAKTTQTNFDGLGRSVQTLLTSDPSGTTYAVKTYDSLGRLGLAYNPTRCNPPTTNCGESTWGITVNGYDALGRSTSITQPDNSQIRRSYSGNCTTVVDEAGKSRKTCMDGLGRLTRAWEDPGGDNFETDYQYDALDNLLCVHQKGSDATADKACTDPSVPAAWRPRTFAYDSLSRLTSANNPESGTITYTYDADGNVITKKAPSPNQPPTGTATITTTYAYDTLNRLAGKSYNDGYTLNNPTPGVSYAYDGNALTGCNTAPPLLTDSYPVGRRTAMCDGSGATSWAHDKMGRILQERRAIGAVRGDYENDTFNLDGSVASVTSLGFNVGYTYGGAAQVLKATHSSTNFVTGATYAPPGELTGMTLGSATGFTGITVNNAYNDRLQPILLSAASPSGTVFSGCFDFHLGVAVNTAPCSFPASTTGDNGNVYQIVNKRNSARSQSFTYDSLNRIGSGYSSGTQWGETYTIDAWGNLTNRAGVTGKTNSEPLSVSAGTNNQLSGFGYDAAGNMTSNSSINASYVYDAENRLIATAGYSYLYDGDGQRVEKCTEGPTPGACATSATGTLYWRGSASDALSETDLAGNVQNTYVFFNGQRVARQDSAGAIHYYFSDHLGSHGVVENATGSVCEQDIDYYPYGGQQHNYCPNAAQNYKFTGKERDSESGLDNFGARFNASNIGRFMSPDAFFKDSHVSDPQSWNEYAYVRNNPLRYTDPNGEKATVYTDCGPDGQGGTWCHVTVSASIVIYSVNGTTTEQLKQAQSAITSQIDKAWSGSFTQDGTTYNVTTNVTVSIASSADAAFNSGAQNAVGISTNADVQSHLEAGPRGSGQDRGVWDFSSITSGQLAPHEFSHALGLDDNHGNNLSNSFSNASMGDHPHATAQDFQWAFGPELHNHQANFTVGQREGRACPFCNNRGNRHWWEVFPEQTEHK